MTDIRPEPLLVEVTRGALVESRHRAHCAVADAAGALVLARGEMERPVYPRSAVKPLQALPLLETGAADAFGLGPREIALACASHRGEPMHLAAVEAWLRRLGLSAQDLECAAPPAALGHNCSGKHAGFLTTARHLGEPTRGYIEPGHPVQQRVRAVLAEMTGCDLSRAPAAIDGCGIPLYGIPLPGIARAMARLADPAGLAGARAAAARRILGAMAQEPLMVAGSGTFTSALLAAAGSDAALKPGAEGVFCAALPGLGLGVALKVEDGAARAAEVAMGALLCRLGALDEGAQQKLAPLLRPRLANAAGREVGEIRAAW
ncbi:MAG TPA: asparaginase [Burkholderiales bacterium]|nr:asparaginase [Burkholderiales bacterium]